MAGDFNGKFVDKFVFGSSSEFEKFFGTRAEGGFKRWDGGFCSGSFFFHQLLKGFVALFEVAVELGFLEEAIGICLFLEDD